MKRATSLVGENGGNVTISIHALVKRATVNKALNNIRIINFNPRPREEGDVKPFYRL